MKKRRFIKGEANHIYQRTVSGFNIFYEIEDYLVYYTVFSMMAIKYDVMVYGLCLMIDHVHSLCVFGSRSSFSGFMSNVTSLFVREYNREHGRSGHLFCENFGSAPKPGMKLLRTAISYIYNNPVERLLCRFAQEYRWNFLAYAHSMHPFSDRLILRKASFALRKAIEEVNGSKARGVYMTYSQLKRLFSVLDAREKNQLVDYIIVKYSVIRYDVLTTLCYDGYQNMITAINSNAGTEYEIDEYRWGKSDAAYRELYKFVHSHGYLSAGEVITLCLDEKISLHNSILSSTTASSYQICKFLHLPLLKPRVL